MKDKSYVYSYTVFRYQTPCFLDHFSDTSVVRYSLRAYAGVLKTCARVKLKLVPFTKFLVLWVATPCRWGLGQRHGVTTQKTGNRWNLKPRTVYSCCRDRRLYYTTKWGTVFFSKANCCSATQNIHDALLKL